MVHSPPVSRKSSLCMKENPDSKNKEKKIAQILSTHNLITALVTRFNRCKSFVHYQSEV